METTDNNKTERKQNWWTSQDGQNHGKVNRHQALQE